jgi:molybdate transport system ATP-binding protein
LVGLNLLSGHGAGRVVDLVDGGLVQAADDCEGNVFVAFPPQAVTLARVSDGLVVPTSARNHWELVVQDLQPFHGRVRVVLGGPPDVVAEVTPAAVADLGLAVGQPVIASVKATEIEVYPG